MPRRGAVPALARVGPHSTDPNPGNTADRQASDRTGTSKTSRGGNAPGSSRSLSRTQTAISSPSPPTLTDGARDAVNPQPVNRVAPGLPSEPALLGEYQSQDPSRCIRATTRAGCLSQPVGLLFNKPTRAQGPENERARAILLATYKTASSTHTSSTVPQHRINAHQSDATVDRACGTNRLHSLSTHPHVPEWDTREDPPHANTGAASPETTCPDTGIRSQTHQPLPSLPARRNRSAPSNTQRSGRGSRDFARHIPPNPYKPTPAAPTSGHSGGLAQAACTQEVKRLYES